MDWSWYIAPAAYFLLFMAALSAYWNSFEGRLFFDDLSSVRGNWHIQVLANPRYWNEDVRWTKDGLIQAFLADIDTPFAGRPMVSITFALNHWWASYEIPSEIPGDYSFLEPHAPYYHRVNFAFHVAVALLLWHLLRRTFRAPNVKAYTGRYADLWATAAALIWVVHPINTETVVYVTQRTEQVISFFLLLTMYCCSRSITSRFSVVWMTLATLFCALGMASKENMVAAPLLVVLYDRAFYFRTWRETFERRWMSYLPIFATYGVLAAINWSAPRGQSVGFGFERMGTWEYLITQCWCLSRYLRITLIPTGLCVDYGRLPVLDLGHVVPGAVIVLSMLALTVWGWFKHPWVGFLGCWFFFILAPTSSFVPIVTEVGAERRMYLPVAAVLLGIGIAVALLIRKFYLQNGRRRLELPEALVGGTVIGCIAVLFGVMSYLRNIDYKNDRTLYGHIAKTFPWNERGCNNYAKICIDEGRTDEAEQLLNQALKIDPEYSDAFTNRGIIYHRRAQTAGVAPHEKAIFLSRAVQNATEAIRWNPLNPSAWNNRGNAFLEMKMHDKAVEDFTELVKMNPYGVEGYYGRANTYYLWGKLDEALKDINAVIERSPSDFKAYNTRGNIQKQQAFQAKDDPPQQLRKLREAIASLTLGAESLYKAARSHHIDSLDAVLAVVQRGDLTQHPKAMQFGERKTLATIFGNRADAYRQIGDQDPNAKKQMFDDLLRAKWMDPENHVYTLATAQQLFNDKKFQEAFNEFELLLRIQPNNADGLWGRALTAHELKNWDAMWQSVKVLRAMGANIDEATLKKWREDSGRDIPK